MALYFKDIEITKLRDLAPQTGLDITDMWFSSTNVYTVWQTYEGTLPATINANGDDMRQYQIYGNTGGVGDRTVQLFDKSTTELYPLKSDGSLFPPNLGAGWVHSDYIECQPGETYTAYGMSRGGANTYHCIYDENQTFVRSILVVANQNAEITFANGEKYIRLSVRDSNATHEVETAMFFKGTTPPETFVPFGYKLDMATGSNILQSSEIEKGGWQAVAGTLPQKIANPKRCRSKNIYPISSKKIFYDFKSLNVNIAFIDSDGLSLGGSGFKSGVGSVDVLENAVKCLFIIANTDTSADITLTQVIAAGIWASVDATTTPIYIGSDPLGKGEYVDYETQKVYRQTESLYDGTYMRKGLFNQDGGISANDDYRISQYMELGGNHLVVKLRTAENRYRSTYPAVWYDENKTILKVAPLEWLVDAKDYIFKYPPVTGAKYVRIDYRYNDTGIEVFETWEEDPPVPLPALPTCEGTTIVDYAGSGTAPEKVLLKYRKEGY